MRIIILIVAFLVAMQQQARADIQDWLPDSDEFMGGWLGKQIKTVINAIKIDSSTAAHSATDGHRRSDFAAQCPLGAVAGHVPGDRLGVQCLVAMAG